MLQKKLLSVFRDLLDLRSGLVGGGRDGDEVAHVLRER
jgi:hypothetical protein